MSWCYCWRFLEYPHPSSDDDPLYYWERRNFPLMKKEKLDHDLPNWLCDDISKVSFPCSFTSVRNWIPWCAAHGSLAQPPQSNFLYGRFFKVTENGIQLRRFFANFHFRSPTSSSSSTSSFPVRPFFTIRGGRTDTKRHRLILMENNPSDIFNKTLSWLFLPISAHLRKEVQLQRAVSGTFRWGDMKGQ